MDNMPQPSTTFRASHHSSVVTFTSAFRASCTAAASEPVQATTRRAAAPAEVLFRRARNDRNQRSSGRAWRGNAEERERERESETCPKGMEPALGIHGVRKLEETSCNIS